MPDLPAGAPNDPVVEFFDRRAADYDREYNDATPGGYALRIRRKKVLDLFDQPGGKVLDVGCGPGIMAPVMLERGCSFWGVDPSQKMIGIGMERFGLRPRTHFLCGDAMNLPVAGSFFDAVLCMGVMDALADRRAAVREMVRVLKPGGTMIVTFTNHNSPYSWWKNHAFYPAVGVWHSLRAKVRHRRGGKTRALYTRQTATALLNAEGVEVRDAVGYYYNMFISPLDEVMPGAALWATRKLEEETSWSPSWLPAGWIFKARKR